MVKPSIESNVCCLVVQNEIQLGTDQIHAGMRSSILNAMTSDWYAVNFWCGDRDWILDEQYEKIKNKPKRCPTRNEATKGRHPMYRENPDDQGWFLIYSR